MTPAPAPTPLFRPEAVAAAAASPAPVLALPPRADRALLLMLAAVVAALAAVSQVPLARHVRVPGLLQPAAGTLTLAAPVAGVLLQRPVPEGALAPPGTVLAWIGQDRSAPPWPADGEVGAIGTPATDGWAQRRHALDERGRALAHEHAAQLALLDQEGQDLHARRARLGAERTALADEARWLAERRALAEASTIRWQALADEGLAPREQAQAAQAQRAELGARAAQADRQAAALAREDAGLAAALAALPARRAAAQARHAQASASLAEAVADWDARRAQALRAGTTVRVLQWLQPAGAAVAAGGALAVLAPPDGAGPAWEAQLFAPSRALGHVSPGQTVRLRLAAWPAARWGHLSGRVHEVGAVPLGPADLPAHQAGALAAALQSPEPLYRVAVRLDEAVPRLRGQALALRAGLSLDADLLHERRPLWAWVLAPWQRWRQRLDSPDA